LRPLGLSEARKILRQACHILAELGDGAHRRLKPVPHGGRRDVAGRAGEPVPNSPATIALAAWPTSPAAPGGSGAPAPSLASSRNRARYGTHRA
jgi:hypothetical protein